MFGVGMNDANYPVYITANIDGRQKRLWICPFYQAWAGMIRRCYSKKFHSIFPTYIDCTVAQEWLRFSAFREWMQNQDWEEKHLDKDILINGNRIYSKETCVFVSPQLNRFMTDSAAIRGKWPIGVSCSGHKGKFKAKCCNPFAEKYESLGYFDDPEEAHEVWRAKKHEHACRYADMQDDHRIADALRSRYSKPQIDPL